MVWLKQSFVEFILISYDKEIFDIKGVLAVSFKNYSHEEVAEMSMIEIAHEILTDEKQALDFNELFDKVASIKGYTKEQKKVWIAQLFTDLNVDGRFLTIGSNMWGLKRWYPVEQAEEEVQAPVKKKKKKAAPKKKKQEEEKADIEEEEIEDDLDLDDEELDLDADGEENSGLDEDFDLSDDDDYEDTAANDESLYEEGADDDEEEDNTEEAEDEDKA